MQISEDYKAFQKRTLIVVADRMQAKMYLAENRSAEEIETMTANGYPLDDVSEKPRKMRGGVAVQRGVEDENIKNRVMTTFFKQVANSLMIKQQDDVFEELFLIIPEENKNELINELHTSVRDKLVGVITKNLTTKPLSELIPDIENERHQL